MKRCLLFISVLIISYNLFSQESEIKNSIISFGLGFGLEYGGIGGNLTMYPHENIGVIGGFGYNLADIGYNVGFKARYTGKNLSPFFIGMYGYNIAIYVEKDTELNKVFYGPNFGFGIDTHYNTGKIGYWSVTLNFPIRDQKNIDDYIDYLETMGIVVGMIKLPFTVSLGYNFVLK